MRGVRIPRPAGVLASVLAWVLAVGLAGCGQGGTGGLTGGGRGPADGVGVPPVLIGLVTKTDTNPYFIRIREAAITAATQWPGAHVAARAGAYDGDNDGQVTAVRDLLARGASTILITPSNSTGIVPVLAEARARGVLVIALDTETTPVDAVDATVATDNVEAGTRAGAALRAAVADPRAPVALLDGVPGSAVSEQRHRGFLAGYGVAEGAPPVVAAVPTSADTDTARAAATDLLARHPDLRGVYAINEPVAAGVHEALLARGLADRVKVATVDGSCPGVLQVRSGRLAADVMQFPTAMATRGVDAAMAWASRRERPPPRLDTGSEVVAGPDLVSMVGSSARALRDPTWGLRNCWG